MSLNEIENKNPTENDKKNLLKNVEEESEEGEGEEIEELEKDINTSVNMTILNTLYPPVRDESFFDENICNSKILRLVKEKSNLRKEELTIEEFEKKRLEITDKFLQDLVKDPCPLPKTNIIDVVSLFIRNSTLINKLESSYNWKSEEELTSLCNLISKNLNYEKFNKGDILFRIGEIGNKFYFIIKGYISILKLKEISKVRMSYSQYFNLCLKLLKDKEYHILEETLKKNSGLIPINSIVQLKQIYTIIFKKKLHENILAGFIYNNNSLMSFFTKNDELLEKYDINLRELQPLEDLNKIKDWKSYLIRRIKPTKDEINYFDKYKEYITRKIELINITYYVYEDFLYLGEGFYFGENALEKGNIYTGGKRNATIRAETELICGSMKGGDYLSIIEPKKRMETIKEIKFIYNNFFFKEISVFLFEKNYFHLFSSCQFKKNDVIINTGAPFNNLFFICEGEVSLNMTSSILNLHNLIKYLYDYIFKNELFQKLPQNKQNKLLNNKTINAIKEYINEPLFRKLRGFSIKFNEELNKKRDFKIASSGENDILGLEELYLKISYITKVTVLSKKLSCYQINQEHMEQILSTEKEISYPFLKAAVNKIVVLIQRLQNIKQHYIKYFIKKYEKNTDYEDKNDLNNNNENENILKKNYFSFAYKSQDIEKNNNIINNSNENGNVNNKLISQNNSIINKYNNLENKQIIDSPTNNSKILKKRNKSPLKISLQLSNKIPRKQLLINIKKNNNSSKNSHINIKIADNNKIRPRNNFDYNNGVDLYNIKKKKPFKTNPKMKFFNFENKNKKDLIIGDINISISKLKNQFNEIQLLSQENNDLIQIIQSNKYSEFNNKDISKDNKSKDESIKEPIFKGSSNYLKYHLSYVPLSNIKKRERKTNPNLFNTGTITSNFTPFQLTIFSTTNSNNNDNNSQAESRNNNIKGNKTNFNSLSYNNNNQLSSYESKDKNQQNISFHSYNYNSRNIPKVFNLKSQEKFKGKINKQIKEFYNDLKSKGCLSFIPNSIKNTFFARKYNEKCGSASKNNYKYLMYNNASQNEINKSKKFLPIIKHLIK